MVIIQREKSKKRRKQSRGERTNNITTGKISRSRNNNSEGTSWYMFVTPLDDEHVGTGFFGGVGD